MGKELRKFRDKTCKAFGGTHPEAGATSQVPRGRKKNVDHAPVNLLTYKLHAMGDYEATIRAYGTTDSYNTQIVRVVVVLFCLYPNVVLDSG
jgi:hypothetical protein